MNKLTILMTLIVVISLVESMEVNRCRKKASGRIEKLEITGCDSYPCKLKKNSKPTINIKFKLRRRVNGLRLKIAGKLNGREIPFSVDDSHHCQNTIVNMPSKCILRKGSSYDYTFSLPILKEYPSLMVVVKYELVDKRGRPVLCFSFPAKIEE